MTKLMILLVNIPGNNIFGIGICNESFSKKFSQSSTLVRHEFDEIKTSPHLAPTV
jgi:hypothetical protein